MPILKLIANSRTKKLFRKLEQPQNEGLIDVLTFAKAVDGQILPEERAELETAMAMLNWQGGTTVERYIDESVKRAQDLMAHHEQVTAYLQNINERLAEDWLREEGYYISALIATSDKEIDESERALLQEMVSCFGISAKRQESITRKLMNETTF